MNDLKQIIRESYDSRPVTETLSWASIKARPIKRRRSWRLPVLLIAIVFAGGVAVATGGTDANRLPPTDFDVALAPNWDGEGNLIDRSTDLDGEGRPSGALLPGVSFRVDGVLGCLATPGSASAMQITYGQIGDFRSLTEQDFIEACMRGWYRTDGYKWQILKTASVTANEIRGVDSEEPALPDAFAVCVSGVDTASVFVIPGFEGITDLSRACQNNALHPLNFNGEKRERFHVSDFPEFQAWLDRVRKVKYEYPGFAHMD